MSDKIIWYRTFYNPMEANIIRAKLEDSGFHCFLADENISIMNPLYNQAIGGVKLMVFERDTPKIDLLLSEENLLENAKDQLLTESINDVKIVCEKMRFRKRSLRTSNERQIQLVGHAGFNDARSVPI